MGCRAKLIGAWESTSDIRECLEEDLGLHDFYRRNPWIREMETNYADA